MYYYFKGKVTHIDTNFIVLEVNNIGYQIYTPRTESFIINEEMTIYLYNVVREDEQYLAGFTSLDEKKAFEALIAVKGIGPRTALTALSATNPNDLFMAIQANNVNYLKKLPGIGPKAAAQIILDLKGQLTHESKADINQYKEVREGLKGLGFKVKEIDDVLAKINIPNATNEEIFREALKKLRK